MKISYTLKLAGLDSERHAADTGLLWQMMFRKLLLPLKMESRAGNWPLWRRQVQMRPPLPQARNW